MSERTFFTITDLVEAELAQIGMAITENTEIEPTNDQNFFLIGSTLRRTSLTAQLRWLQQDQNLLDFHLEVRVIIAKRHFPLLERNRVRSSLQSKLSLSSKAPRNQSSPIKEMDTQTGQCVFCYEIYAKLGDNPATTIAYGFEFLTIIINTLGPYLTIPRSKKEETDQG